VAGVPAELARLVRVAPWGNLEALDTALSEIGVDVAAVVVDPIASQFGVVLPKP
jgi:glutamate-1-semialdehyde aminotransferase